MTDIESITLPAALPALDDLSKFVGELAKVGRLSENEVYRLRLAADEIATNIMVHGYAESGVTGAASIEVVGQVDATLVRLRLVDDAPPFDPTSVPDPKDLGEPLGNRSIGGLGIYLTRSALDEFVYRRVDDRNEVTLGISRSETEKEHD